MEDHIPEHDQIDEQLLSLIRALVGEDAPDEDVDAASNILFNLIEKLVDDGEMQEIPDTEAPEDQKQKWLDEHSNTLRVAFEQLMAEMADDDFQTMIDLERSLSDEEE